MGHVESKTLAEIKAMDLASLLEASSEIWDSIVETAEPLPLSKQDKKLLDERDRAYRENPVTYSWEEVQERVLKSLDP